MVLVLPGWPGIVPLTLLVSHDESVPVEVPSWEPLADKLLMEPETDWESVSVEAD
jgi:hypothetical protein